MRPSKDATEVAFVKYVTLRGLKLVPPLLIFVPLGTGYPFYLQQLSVQIVSHFFLI